ncbi:PRA1 family protein 2-like [Salarias fasciatus]|uniref:PRA1 family protein n=1 Tax=Salarias fasciatus TaxID=181472 RepID=A0A672FD25_SALFA|nr:PRA1 family protein 2-like [Salarias fasciatus]
MAAVQPPPLRSLDDFLLSTARFAVPDVRDLDRWNNRIINNLLYYQSNYLLSALGLLLLAGYLRPLQTVLGAAVVSVLFLGLIWGAEHRAPIRRFRRNHPLLSLLAVLSLSYTLLTVLRAAAVFLFAIAFPILMILVHASLRLRNLKNKLENRLESIGLKRTPMGLLLEALGQEQEAGS